MTNLYEPFIGEAFLQSAWARDYEHFKDSEAETGLLACLENWSMRKDLKETSAESAFIQQFFHDTWGYFESGQRRAEEGFSTYPKYSVEGAGQKGGTGEADLALGWFEREGIPDTPQVLCEFKGIRSKLDAPQKRKGNNRSPVKQCLDYLFHTRRILFGNEAVIPSWGIVTDMNEFRLYWFDRAPQQYIRFVINPDDPLFTRSLLDPSEKGRFHRFLFYKIFHSETLLTTGGKSLLAKLITHQWVREREIENEFYGEYRALRDHLYKMLVKFNPAFPGTPGKLVRLSQRILDRFIFVFYCEDMGDALDFPHQLLKDFLVHYSRDEFYDPNGSEVWERLKRLFKIMNTGGTFPPDKKIKCFNGGLFEDDPELEGLVIPNNYFCERGQGHNEASLYSATNTLLFLSATYNFAAKGDASKSLGLYTLGRIFEQSITELEILEAEAEGRESLNKISKRKRDGVYYTPEHIVEKIVQETLGLRLNDLKNECGWKGDLAPNKKALEGYWEGLQNLTVLDPACGSGAFLITALRMLLEEFHSVFEQRRKFEKRKVRDPEDAILIKDILSRNIYGVDINPSSLEVAKLSLWLHTARRGEKLSALDTHFRDGNSLIDDTFYLQQSLLKYPDEEKERINAFNWWEAFPEVEGRGGFDVVISNPPYVKLQNFRRVHSDMADYLREGRQGKSYYESTQTGNFDLYLPFIEKSISLLNEHGHMGFIAPSLWTMNDYGLGLKRMLSRTRQLDRWVDFKSYQVFEEATTYTALQFFTRGANENVRIVSAPTGDLTTVAWDNPDNRVPYDDLDPEDIWLLLPRSERELIKKLRRSCRRLDNSSVTKAIYQGLITSADYIYHLTRLGPGRYLCKPRGKNNPPYEVSLEDSLMHPLVSGPEAKRYLRPETNTYLLFPYEVVDDRAELISAIRMEHEFPNAWQYLLSYERVLRDREKSDDQRRREERGEKTDAGLFDDNQWYRFGRHQNLNKQEIPKLIVAQTVPHLRICFDYEGSKYLNNVRVNGILPADDINGWVLLGLLNGPVCDFIFRRIAAPKSGGYFEANKQFIAPLPIPDCDDLVQNKILENARSLHEQYSELREMQNNLRRRLGDIPKTNKPNHWIFPDLGTIGDWEERAPISFDSQKRKDWAKEEYALALESHYEDIERFFRPDVRLDVRYEAGELRFLVDERVVIERVFVNENEGPFLLAQWQRVADTFTITEKAKGKSLVAALRKIVKTDNEALRTQVVELHHQIAALKVSLANTENHLNDLLYEAYDLTEDERRLVEKG